MNEQWRFEAYNARSHCNKATYSYCFGDLGLFTLQWNTQTLRDVLLEGLISLSDSLDELLYGPDLQAVQASMEVQLSLKSFHLHHQNRRQNYASPTTSQKAGCCSEEDGFYWRSRCYFQGLCSSKCLQAHSKTLFQRVKILTHHDLALMKRQS